MDWSTDRLVWRLHRDELLSGLEGWSVVKAASCRPEETEEETEGDVDKKLVVLGELSIRVIPCQCPNPCIRIQLTRNRKSAGHLVL